MTQFFAAFEDLFKSIYELFASIIGTFAHAIQAIISTVLNFFSGIINLFTDVFKGVVDVVGGVGSFVISKSSHLSHSQQRSQPNLPVSKTAQLTSNEQAISWSSVSLALGMSSTLASSKESPSFLQRRPTRKLMAGTSGKGE